MSAGTSIAQSTSEDSIEQSISEDSNGDAIRTDTVSFKDSVEKKSVSVEPTRKEKQFHGTKFQLEKKGDASPKIPTVIWAPHQIKCIAIPILKEAKLNGFARQQDSEPVKDAASKKTRQTCCLRLHANLRVIRVIR